MDAGFFFSTHAHHITHITHTRTHSLSPSFSHSHEPQGVILPVRRPQGLPGAADWGWRPSSSSRTRTSTTPATTATTTRRRHRHFPGRPHPQQQARRLQAGQRALRVVGG